MLSILIPVYNFDCVDLVSDLHQQGQSLSIGFEIIVLEDASTRFLAQNHSLHQLFPNIKYERLSKNIGRASIRNLLAQKAVYDYLLFIDCDSAVIRKDYLKRYVAQLNPKQLLYGGRVYQEKPPKEKAFHLHWKFGRHREQIPAKQRGLQPYQSFMTNNFVVPKAIFQPIKFDENLKQYGHEDTLFGMELKSQHIPILHLDNPLEHIGLERTDVFLEKTEKALENLTQLHKAGKKIDTKLLRTYNKISSYKLNLPLKIALQFLQPVLKSLLYRKKPALFIFDCYKLSVFIQKM
ncbi:MAG: glycosyltransferase [Bacteroidota bacterium]